MKLLVFDAPALCYRAWYSMGGLSYEGQDTGIIYGFLKQVYSLFNPFGPSWTPVFCWDSRQSLRRAILPTYKCSRRETPKSAEEEAKKALARRQFGIVRTRVLPMLGFANNFIQEGFESDDLIAALVRNSPAKKVVFVSSDKDLYQLLTDNSWMVNPADGKAYTKARFEADWGLLPEDWSIVKAYAGCSTDDVPGIPGVGEATAAKYMRGELTKGAKFESIRNFPDETYQRNIRLVRLPFENTRTPRIDDSTFDKDGFLLVCDEFRFASLEKDVDRWAALFGGAL